MAVSWLLQNIRKCCYDLIDARVVPPYVKPRRCEENTRMTESKVRQSINARTALELTQIDGKSELTGSCINKKSVSMLV